MYERKRAAAGCGMGTRSTAARVSFSVRGGGSITAARLGTNREGKGNGIAFE